MRCAGLVTRDAFLMRECRLKVPDRDRVVEGGLDLKGLADLDADDLKFHTDFRRVYATLLDRWLGCDSNVVLGGKFEPLELLKAKA